MQIETMTQTLKDERYYKVLLKEECKWNGKHMCTAGGSVNYWSNSGSNEQYLV